MSDKVLAAKVMRDFNELAERFSVCCSETGGNATRFPERLEAVCEEVRKREEGGILSVAFVGAYNAGKSTIIKALTGQDVKISADIATDECTEYEWEHFVRLVDTPGLYTERTEHSELTKEAIRKADLLVYCLTHSLLDSVILPDFVELAYERRYAPKMLLVVNKLSSEGSGDETDVDTTLIENYCESLRASLKNHDFDSFATCFIDAKDHIDGIGAEDEELLKMSRFETLISALNTFVEERGFLGRLDTPLHAFLGVLDDATLEFSRDAGEDDAYMELLSRMQRRLNRVRAAVTADVNLRVSEVVVDIVSKGDDLANMIDGKADVSTDFESANAKIEKNVLEMTVDVEKRVNAGAEELRVEFSEELAGTLADDFFSEIGNVEMRVDAPDATVDGSTGERIAKTQKLLGVAKSAGIKISDLATKEGVSKGLLKASQASGSHIHKVVLSAGHKLGFKFKPWQAANLTKIFGNAAKAIPFVTAIIEIALLCVEEKREEDADKKLSEARNTASEAFGTMADQIRKGAQTELRRACSELFGPPEAELRRLTAEHQKLLASMSQVMADLSEIRDGLYGLSETVASSGGGQGA